jgi:glycosyltransferase involved in cell wall biosynthesis
VDKLPELSVFFPLYNEEKNVETLVKEALEVFVGIAREFEVILINDGSTDNTLEIGKKMEKEYKKIRLVSQNNRGYGGALKRGFKESKYNWIFLSDGDLQFDLYEVNKFLPFLESYDLVIGYRTFRAEGIKRQIIMIALKFWNKIFLRFPLFIKDIDCAFKFIKKDVIDAVEPLVSDGAMLSTELLLKAYKKGFRIKQIPVKHFKRKFGRPTGNSLKVILKAVRETFVLRKIL